jgi:aspartate aminotransferase
MISKRIKNIKPSFIIKYYSMLFEREKEGIKFIKANLGQPDFRTDIKYYDSLKSLNNKKVNRYIEAEGLYALRKAVSTFYNKNNNNYFCANDVIITQGASDAIIKILYSICDVNDEIIILEPFFSDYKIYAEILGIKIKTLKYNNFDYNDISNKINKKTKAILFASPNNPDGNILSFEQINIILKVARKHKLFVISDEVYSGFVYNNSYYSLSCFKYRRILIVDSASKKFNSCGSRIGFVISKNKEILKSIVTLNDSKISISYTEQYAISKMFPSAQKIILKSKQKYEKRLKIMLILLKKYNIKYITPKGGISVLIELPIKSSDEYISWVIKNYQLNGESFIATPAEDFYSSGDGKNKIRISLTMSTVKMKKIALMMNNSLIEYMKRM